MHDIEEDNQILGGHEMSTKGLPNMVVWRDFEPKEHLNKKSAALIKSWNSWFKMFVSVWYDEQFGSEKFVYLKCNERLDLISTNSCEKIYKIIHTPRNL